MNYRLRGSFCPLPCINATAQPGPSTCMHGCAQQSETWRHPNRLPPGLCASARSRICWTGGTTNTTEGLKSCADLPLSKRHVLLAPCPVLECTLVSPPPDAGIPCAQQGGEKKPHKTGYHLLGNIYSCYTQYQGSCNFCLFIFLLLFFPLAFCVLGGCVCYYKVYWNINIYF